MFMNAKNPLTWGQWYIWNTVFPRIVSAETILFWKLYCGNYSREETIQGRKLFAEIRYSIFLCVESRIDTAILYRAQSRSAHCQDRPALPFQEASGPCPDAPRGPKILTPARPAPERSGAPPRGPWGGALSWTPYHDIHFYVANKIDLQYMNIAAKWKLLFMSLQKIP